MILIVSPYDHNIKQNHAFDQLGRILFPQLKREFALEIFLCEEIIRKERFSTIRKISSLGKFILTLRPAIIANHWSSERKREFRLSIKKFAPKLIHFEYFQTTLINRQVTRIGFTYTLHDSLSRNNPYFSTAYGLKNLYHKLQYKLMIIHETRVIKKAEKVFVFNNEDFDYVKSKKGNPKLVTVGIGDMERIWNPSNLLKKEVVFAGALWRRENEEICLFIIDQLLPKVILEFPDIRFVLLGSSPSRKLIEEAQLITNIKILANVEDFSREMSQFSISLCLSKVNPGISMKFLQSLKIGIPIIANMNVAYSLNQEVSNKNICLIAESPDEIAKAIRDIFENQEIGVTIAKNARVFMNQNYTLGEYFECYCSAFQELILSHKKIRP